MFMPATRDRRYAAKRQVAIPYNIPSSTGGINARDNFSDMDPKDAVDLENVFPEANYCVVRNGFTPWATGMGANPVETILVWNGLTGQDQLFGAAGPSIWSATNSGTSTAVVNGLSNARWQWTNLENAGGLFLTAVNGVDAPINYDGTTWGNPVFTGSADPTKFVNIVQFKERLWFASVNSLTLYYLDIQAIQGPTHAFPLGGVFRRGGYVIALGSFSNDAGEGPDDYFVIATNQGEVAIYQGTNPDSATTWSLVGIFNIGKPIGRRCMVHLSGDLAIITQDGIESMQAALRFDRSSGQKAAITSKIQTLFSNLSNAYYTNFGWQPTVFPRARYLIVNVPQIENMTQVQLVMNTITGSWCRFTGQDANCWGIANDQLYFGGNYGTLYNAAVGFQDQVQSPLIFINNSGGILQFQNNSMQDINFVVDTTANIPWSMQTSWQALGGKMNKLFTAVRPEMVTGGGIVFTIEVHVDFAPTRPHMGPLLSPIITGMIWPFTWPGTWGGATVFTADWRSVGGFGTWSSIHIEGIVSGALCQIQSFDLGAQKQQGTWYG
jgi:hypothetical protein